MKPALVSTPISRRDAVKAGNWNARVVARYGAVIQSNVVGPEGGQVLVEETVKMINAMW